LGEKEADLVQWHDFFILFNPENNVRDNVSLYTQMFINYNSSTFYETT